MMTEMVEGHTDFVLAVDRLAACKIPDEVPGQLLDPVASLIGADAATLLNFRKMKRGDVALDRWWSHNVPDRSARAYAERFYHSDPMIRRHLLPAFGQPHPVAQSLVERVSNVEAICHAEKSRDADDYLTQFWEPLGMSEMIVIGCWIPALTDQGLVIAFHRAAGAESFSTEAILRAERIAPVMGTVLGHLFTAIELDRQRVISDALGHMVESHGVAVVDGDKNLIYANRRAELHWLGEQATAEDTQQILDCAEDRPWRLGNIGIIASEIDHRPNHRLIVTSDSFSDNDIHRRCHAYGLTVRESEVAALVCNGLSNPEVAEILSISIRTVENHLRAVFDKVGVDSRARLMRIMLGQS